MLHRIVIVLGLLLGSFLAAWGASSTLSGLNFGNSIAPTDLFYDVQQTGVGGVKVTGTQFLQFIYSHVSGSCTASGNGVFVCSTGSIAAGTNITTSGSVTNTIVSVVTAPTFTNLTVTNNFVLAGLGGSTQCVHSVAGLLQGTGSDCGAGGGGGATSTRGGPVLPSSEYLGAASGNIAPTFFIPGSNTSGAGAFEGIGIISSLTSTVATATLQFNMPENMPLGNARLRILQMSTASTGSVQYTVSDAATSASNSLGTVTLNYEGNFSVAQTVADQLIEKKLLLTVTPTANQIMSVLIGVTSNVAAPVIYQPSIVWE